MINVSELIDDPDFCQPEGIFVSRFINEIVDHRVFEKEIKLNIRGIVIALEKNEDELKEVGDQNKEGITILTYERLKTVGIDKMSGISYGSDIVHYRGNDYIVRVCEDLEQYGYCRSYAYKMEQDRT